MATQTETYKLNKPDRTDKIGIAALNENMDIIEEELKKRALNSDVAGVAHYDLDLTAWVSVDFADKSGATFTLTDNVDGGALLTAISAGRMPRVKFLHIDGTPHVIALNGRSTHNTASGVRTICSGTASNIYYDAYSNYSLNVWDNEGEYTVTFVAYPFLTGEGTVKSVNGVQPDENGNVEVPTAEGTVKFVNGVAPDETGNVELLSTTGLAIDWANGTYTETLSDGTSHTEDIEFDTNGVPTKFGSMVFSITGG